MNANISDPQSKFHLPTHDTWTNRYLSTRFVAVGLFKTRGVPDGVADSVTAVRGFRNRAQRMLPALGRHVHAVIFENRVLPGCADGEAQGAGGLLYGVPGGYVALLIGCYGSNLAEGHVAADRVDGVQRVSGGGCAYEGEIRQVGRGDLAYVLRVGDGIG